MLARRSTLRLPDGTEADLPLLVPSFSSKGFTLFPPRQAKSHLTRSALSTDLHEFGQTPSQAVLISAFDLHFEYFQLPDEPSRNCLDWIPNVRVIFLDSGGYELAPYFDISEPKTPPYHSREDFGPTEYDKVLQRLGHRLRKRNFVVSNFDWGTRGQPLDQQLAAARRLKRRHPNVLHNFILKPWSASMTIVDPRKIAADGIGDIGGFDIVGVTEKELGIDLLERLRRVAQLRTALNGASIRSPIHVWGGLDPLLTPLYFFAGAQIFDGLSWLRYAYVDGLAVSRECASVLDLELGVEAPRRFAYPMTALRNRSYLERLTGYLQQWADYDGRNFTMFPRFIRGHLERAYKTMVTKIPELRETHHGR